jgi:hypothetical protein
MSRYRHQYKNFGDAVLRSEWMVAEMRRRAEAVKAAAVAAAPVGDPAKRIGILAATRRLSGPRRVSVRRRRVPVARSVGSSTTRRRLWRWSTAPATTRPGM